MLGKRGLFLIGLLGYVWEKKVFLNRSISLCSGKEGLFAARYVGEKRIFLDRCTWLCWEEEMPF